MSFLATGGIISSRLEWPPVGPRTLVPFADETEMVVKVVPASSVWGAVSSYHQYEQAQKHSGMHLLLGDFARDISVQRESFGLALFEAPQWWLADSEYVTKVLREAIIALQPGGILVAVVSDYAASDGRLATLFAGWLDRVTSYNFGKAGKLDREWLVVFGERKTRYQTPAKPVLDFVRSALKATVGNIRYRVPASHGDVTEWRTQQLDPMEALDGATGAPLLEHVKTLGGQRKFGNGVPPIAMKQGHLALQLAAGRLDGVIGQGRNRHVIKGRVRRNVYVADATGTTYDAIEEERFDANLTALTPDGRVVRIS